MLKLISIYFISVSYQYQYHLYHINIISYLKTDDNDDLYLWISVLNCWLLQIYYDCYGLIYYYILPGDLMSIIIIVVMCFVWIVLMVPTKFDWCDCVCKVIVYVHCFYAIFSVEHFAIVHVISVDMMMMNVWWCSELLYRIQYWTYSVRWYCTVLTIQCTLVQDTVLIHLDASFIWMLSADLNVLWYPWF